MWFKFSSELFDWRIFKLCQLSAGRGDRNAPNRVLILIRILSESVDAMHWKSADELAALLKLPQKDVVKVWDLCIDEGVLRPLDNGFSAFEYMKEKALIGDLRPKDEMQNLTMRGKNIF